MHRISISGPTHHASYLTKYLESDYETLLISGIVENGEKDGSHILSRLDIKPRYIKEMHRSIHPIKDFKAYKEIKKIIREFKPHIVHTHAAKSGALGRLAAIHEGVPVIVHTFHGHVFHSYFGKFKTWIFLKIERYLAKNSNRIIAISNKQKEELSKRFKITTPERIEVVKLGFDLNPFVENSVLKREKFRQEFNLEEDRVAFGIIGRITGIKNHEHFIRSYAIHKKTNGKKSVAFVIGDGEMREASVELATSLNLIVGTPRNKKTNPDIIFTSWREDVDTIVNGLDVICLTSLNEGTPVTLIEAQAAQKPILSTNVGGIEDIVVKDKSAYLYETNDIEGFAIGMNLLTNDLLLRKSMGKHASRVLESFSYQRLVNDINSLYKKLLKEKNVT